MLVERAILRTAARAALAAVCLFGAVLGAPVAAGPFPPWADGDINPALDRGETFAVPDIDNVADLHGNPEGAMLVLFVGGNQFFVMPALIDGFERLYPSFRGHIFYETLPPGILARQIQAGGRLTLGNLTLRVAPDVYEAGARTLAAMQARGEVTNVTAYATNSLAIMVHAGNPRHIRTLRDLARSDVRLAMPNPVYEGVARQIAAALRAAGGDALYRAVYVTKVADGRTRLTQIHHRQTPMWIMQGTVDGGITWASEVRFQESAGNPIGGVAIPKADNVTATYAAGVLRTAPHPGAGALWCAYLRSAQAQAAYRRYGFGKPPP
jgi:molybdate transport system substrate-binding protein